MKITFAEAKELQHGAIFELKGDISGTKIKSSKFQWSSLCKEI